MKRSHKFLLLNALLAGALCALTSCGIIIEAISIKVRQARETLVGEQLVGEGFILRCPEEFLYPTRNFPTHGGVTLRPTEPLFSHVLFVTPFQSATARTTDQALIEWNQNPVKKGFPLIVLRQSHATFAGHPATRAVMQVLQGRTGQIAAMLVIKRSNDFLILAASDDYYYLPSNITKTAPNNITKTVERCERRLSSLQNSTKLTQK